MGPGDILVYSARSVRTSVAFSKAWDRLNGECVYYPTRFGISSGGSETGLDLRLFASRVVLAERQMMELMPNALKLVCVRTGALIQDTAWVKDFFDTGDCLFCVRIELTAWARRRPLPSGRKRCTNGHPW